MLSIRWTVSQPCVTVMILFVHRYMSVPDDECGIDSSVPVYESVTNINGAAFASYGDGYMVLYIGEADSDAVRVRAYHLLLTSAF